MQFRCGDDRRNRGPAPCPRLITALTRKNENDWMLLGYLRLLGHSKGFAAGHSGLHSVVGRHGCHHRALVPYHRLSGGARWYGPDVAGTMAATTGGTVRRWNDKSTARNDVTITNGAVWDYNTYGVNGKAMVSFPDGTRVGVFTNNQPFKGLTAASRVSCVRM